MTDRGRKMKEDFKIPPLWWLILGLPALFFSVAICCIAAFNLRSAIAMTAGDNRHQISTLAGSVPGALGKNILCSVASFVGEGAGYRMQGAAPEMKRWFKWGKSRGARWGKSRGGKNGRVSSSSARKVFNQVFITIAVPVMALVLLSMALSLLISFGRAGIIKYAAAGPSHDKAYAIIGCVFLVVAAVIAAGRAGIFEKPLTVPLFPLGVWGLVGAGLIVVGVGLLFTLASLFLPGSAAGRKVKAGFVMGGLCVAFIGFGIWMRMRPLETKARPAETFAVVESTKR